MIEGEGQMHEEFVPEQLGSVMLLDNVVNVLRKGSETLPEYIICSMNTYGHRRADEKRKNERKDVVLVRP